MLKRTRAYLSLDMIAAAVVSGIYIASLLFTFNNGVFIACLETAASLFLVGFILLDPERRKLGLYQILSTQFLLLAIGDLLFGYFYYYLEIQVPTSFTVLMHEIPLSLSYFTLPFVYLHAMNYSLKRILSHPFAALPLLITLPLMLRFIFPLSQPVATTENPYVKAVELFSLGSTFVGLVLSIAVFAFAKQLFWSLFSLGLISSQIAGLGLRLERLSGGAVHFTYFECLWAFGNLISILAVCIFSRDREEIQYEENNSLILSAKLIGIAVAFATSVALSIFRWRDLFAIESIIYSSLFSIHLAGALGHYLRDKMTQVKKSTLVLEQHAKQVAHDMNSPLTALEICLEESLDRSGEYAPIIQSSLERLKELSSNLSKNRIVTQPIPLNPVIELLVAEKQMELRARSEIEIDTLLQEGLTACVDPGQLRRTLSNLINNAAEAIEFEGKIKVRGYESQGKIHIQIRDNGKGIPEAILPKLGQMGVTYGKTGGQGLGLAHAKRQVESWGGAFILTSQEGLGTEATLSIPII